jgi:drug/metabolite transporter (DMT)-like permease
MEKKLSSFGPLLIVGASLLWSIDGFIRASSLYALPPVLMTFWEHFLGLFLITPFFWSKRHEIKTLTRKDWMPILAIAFFAGPLAGIFYTYALTQISFANFSIVVLLQQTQPIWAILIAGIMLKEKITAKFLILAAVAMSGVYLIVFKVLVPNLNTGNGTALAGMLALLAAMAWGSATSFGKYVLHKVSFGTMAFLRFSLASLFAFILFGIFSAVQAVTGAKDIFGKAHNLNQLFSLTTAQWENLVLIVLISGAGAMLVYYFGLKQTKARVATICELAWPASSLVIGILFFKNTFNVTQIVGIVLLIAAMISISVTQRGKDVVIPEKEV